MRFASLIQISTKKMNKAPGKRVIMEDENCTECGGLIKANGRDDDGVMTYVCEECHQEFYDEREL